MNTLNGATFMSLVVGLILAIPLSLVVTRLFKKKVEKLINSENDFNEILSEPTLLVNPIPFPGITKLTTPVSHAHTYLGKTKTYLSHFIPGLLVCFMILYSNYLQGGSIVMMTAFYLFLCVCFPLLFVTYTLKPSGNDFFGKLLKIYFLLHIMFIVYFLFRSKPSDVFGILYLFLMNIGPTLIFFWLNSRTTIKAIAPFMFPVIFIGSLFIMLGVTLLMGNQAALENVFNTFFVFLDALNIHGLTNVTLYSVVFILFMGFAILGLLLLRGTYNSKNINGQILLIDCLWLTQVIFMTSMPYNDHRAITYAFLILLVYKIVQLVMMKLLGQNAHAGSHQQLLVLRVFSLGKESEKLFGYVASNWLSKGYIKLIAGFDLTNSLVDIDDLLTYLSGGIRKRFCLSETLIIENVNKIDKLPDIDGRYRVNEMYCNNSTWKTVLDKLLPGTNRILMDLRGFSAANKGCIHEIQQIIYSVPMEKVLFVSDSKGLQHGADMYTIMKIAWETIPASSPNYANTETVFCVFEYNNKKDLPGLLYHLSSFE